MTLGATGVLRIAYFLGRSRPSLIEAGAAGMRMRRSSTFLGRSRPSLIEATWMSLTISVTAVAFWGVRAPASLKQGAQGGGEGGPVGLSGAFAPQPH